MSPAMSPYDFLFDFNRNNCVCLVPFSHFPHATDATGDTTTMGRTGATWSVLIVKRGRPVTSRLPTAPLRRVATFAVGEIMFRRIRI